MIFKLSPLVVILLLDWIARTFTPAVFYAALAWFVLGAAFLVFDKGTPKKPLLDLSMLTAASWCSFFGPLFLPLMFSRSEN